MQEEEKKDETPKIIAMIVVIVLCIGFIFYRILGAKSQQTAQAPPPPTTPPTQVAMADTATGPSVTHPADVVGAERNFTPLDEDQGMTTVAPATSSNVFNAPHPPPPIPVPPKTKFPPATGGTSFVDNGHSTAGMKQPPLPVEPPLTHPVDIKIEGVVTGPDGFAMITEGDQTAFKRVGDHYTANYRILRLSENWVTVEHKVVTVEHNRRVTHLVKEVWQPGDKVVITAPGGIPGANSTPSLRPMAVPGPNTSFDTLPAMGSEAAQAADKHKSSNVNLPFAPAKLH